MLLINGDCLDEMKNIRDDFIDLIFVDLPYGQTACKWDCCIDPYLMWEQIMRIKKINTPIIMTTTTKFGCSLIQSAPKKCPFRYDLIWCKSAPCGFLNAKRMPMRKHEMVYLFYEKLPLYDISSHQSKFMGMKAGRKGKCYEDNKDEEAPCTKYDPPLPTSLLRESNRGKDGKSSAYGVLKFETDNKYDPPLPHSLLEIKSTKGKHSTEKPVELMKFFLKYYSKEGDQVLDFCMGSGSTGVACKEMNREFIGIEKDEDIFKFASDRLMEN